MLNLRLFGPVLVAIRTAEALSGMQIARHFRSTLSSGSGVYLPSDANYSEQVTGRWDLYVQPSFVVAARPELVSDVQQIVKYAAAHNVPFLATGGGHGYLESLNQVEQAINLDLGNFNTFNINCQANTLTIGGSVRFINVTDALQKAGKDMPVASCSCVGIIGASLGGGLGPYTGLYGLISDQLLSVTMVTGTGQILNVSATSRPDLFWGLKGAGFNFGVVTSAVYKIHDASNGGYLTNVDMIFPVSKNESVWKAVAQVAASQPKELHFTVALAFNSTSNSSFMLANGNYAGNPSAARTAMKPLLDLNPLNLNVSKIPFVDLATAPDYGLVAGGCTPTGETDFGINLRILNVKTLVNVTNYVARTQAASPLLARSLSSITIPGQAIGIGTGRGANSSAFPWRSVAGFFQVQGSVPSDVDGKTVQEWGAQVRAIVQAGSGYDTLGVYVNTAQGDEGTVAWYTEEKLSALRRLKRQYDPQGLFSFYGPIS